MDWLKTIWDVVKGFSWLKSTVTLWVVIGILVVSTGGFALHWYFTPDVDTVLKEAREWKVAYEQVVNDYELSKKRYNTNLVSIQKKYNAAKLELARLTKEVENVQKPKTSAERVKRLRNLNYPPISQ